MENNIKKISLSDSKDLIYKSNTLARSKYDITLIQARFIAFLSSFVDKDDEDFKEHIFKSADLLKELGLGEKNHLALEQSIDRLMSRIIEIKLDTKNKKERFQYKNMFNTWYNNLPNEYHNYL